MNRIIKQLGRILEIYINQLSSWYKGLGKKKFFPAPIVPAINN